MSLRAFVARVLGLVRSRQVERELHDEIVAYLEQAELDNLRAGMSPEEARRAARLRFGGVEQVKEMHRDGQRFRPLADVVQDVKFGLRSMRKQRAFAAAAIVTLAFGIGANVAIFSVVYGVLLKPLPFPHPDRGRASALPWILDGSSHASRLILPP
ncbi:MAG: hypothetical protein GEV06_01520 [Luteitalea sp.]|nr:hypothetical protein [Luteitalea sp.]